MSVHVTKQHPVGSCSTSSQTVRSEVKRIEFQRMEQACKNGAKRLRRSLQQLITGTEQSQQASDDDGNEHEVINNHTLNFTGAFTRFRDRQGHKNAGSVCCD